MLALYCRPSHQKISNIPRGITLIETLIALMITGVISIICFRAVSSSITLKNHVIKNLQIINKLSHTWTVIDLDLSQICIYPQLSLLKNNKSIMLSPHALNTYPDNSLTFLRYRSPYQDPHIIERVSYLLDNHQLIRTTQKLGSTEEKNILLDKIDNISFTGYFPEKKQWQAINKSNILRPSALNVTITTQDNMTYNRIFLVSVAS